MKSYEFPTPIFDHGTSCIHAKHRGALLGCATRGGGDGAGAADVGGRPHCGGLPGKHRALPGGNPRLEWRKHGLIIIISGFIINNH